MKQLKCDRKTCFANGCDGYCHLEDIKKTAPHLLKDFQYSKWTCNKPRNVVKEFEKQLSIFEIGG